MEENKKVRRKQELGAIILAIGVISLLTGVTFAFFNYTRTGTVNNMGTGRIYFNSTQNGRLQLTNIFPVKASEVDENELDSVTLGIVGDTTYPNGEEYLISFVNVNNTVNGKKIPINYIATYEPVTDKVIGTENSDYWNARENKNANIYLLNETGSVLENKQVLVGFIKNDNEGINGTLTIKAYIDADRIAISDTYDGSEDDNHGTTSSWVNGRTVLTTEEWNSMQSTPISFQIRAESNEGIWVSASENFANKIKGRLGNDGVVAVNSEGDLYTGTGTIREYRYSGIGNYCTYTDGTTNYNISVEGTECPEHAYKGNEGYIAIGSSDGFALWGDNGEAELNRVNTTVTESNLKNYVMFNNEKWRIIGVFGDNVKIMKDLPLTEDVTNNPVDTTGLNGASANDNQLYTNTLNEQYLIKSISYENTHKYGYFYYNFPGDVNYSYKGNDWTHSGLMYYLNEANTGSYYSTIGASYKNLIDNTTYYLGNVTILDGDENGFWVVDGTAKEVYEQERGNLECSASVTAFTNNNSCNIWNGNSATWNGKIGLLYPSDYAYASSSDKWGTNAGAYYHNGGSLNNWMFNTDAGASWMISPAAYGSDYAIEWHSNGDVADDPVGLNSAVRPVLNLVSEAEVVDGDGSYSNPYILNIE